MSGEVAITQYLSMMRVHRHWDHLSQQNSVIFTRYHIQNPFIKSQPSFLNYSVWLVLSPSQAFTVGRAVSWCPKARFADATLKGFYWVGNRSREALLEPGTSQSPTCGPPKATGKRCKQSCLTGWQGKLKGKNTSSLQVPVSPFMTEMWHSKLDSDGPPHIPKPGKPPALLKYEQAALPADFGRFFQCSKCKKCFPHPHLWSHSGVFRSGAAVLVHPLAVGEVADLSDPYRISSTAPRCSCTSFVPPAACTESTWKAEFKPGWYWWWQAGRSEGADSLQLAETLVCFPCQRSTLQ